MTRALDETPPRFADFSEAATNAELRAVDRGHGHWQLLGGVHLVNFYPWASKGPTLYVAGAASGKRIGGTNQEIIAQVIAAVTQPPRREKKAKRRSSSYRRRKQRMMQRDSRCHWCRVPLTLDREKVTDRLRYATLDHKVPLGSGGLDNANNHVLACEPCNADRKDDAGPPKRLASAADER